MPDPHHAVPEHGAPTVRVAAPGRLHLGFLDPSATLGRRFGSLGWVIDGIETVLDLSFSDLPRTTHSPEVDAAESRRAADHLATLQRHTGRDAPLRLHLRQTIAAHAGFGSGTQLALAVGRAFATLHGLPLHTADIARLLGRGLRSGIGIAGFDRGGLLLDGGPGADGSPAPLIARIDPPPQWRALLVMDPDARGLSGSDEKQAIAALPDFDQARAAAVCHEVLMRVLPGAASGDFDAFSAGVGRVQQLVGAHFAPAQQGRLFASARVERVCQWFAQQGGFATGQTSWGPTGFVLLPTADAADAAVAAWRASADASRDGPALPLRLVAPRAHGAVVEPLGAPERAVQPGMPNDR